MDSPTYKLNRSVLVLRSPVRTNKTNTKPIHTIAELVSYQANNFQDKILLENKLRGRPSIIRRTQHKSSRGSKEEDWSENGRQASIDTQVHHQDDEPLPDMKLKWHFLPTSTLYPQ